MPQPRMHMLLQLPRLLCKEQDVLARLRVSHWPQARGLRIGSPRLMDLLPR